jgi:sugar phosphate isomerase/epimerase
MVALSAFADEVADDLTAQVSALRAVGIAHVDVRGVGGRNVTTLDVAEVRAARATLDANEIGVASLASPIGKCPVDTPLAELHGQVERAATYAHILGTPLVRVFSFYPPGLTAPPERDSAPVDSAPVDNAAWRDGALGRLDAMTSWARDNGIVLLVENEKGTYAATVEGCAEICGRFGGDYLGTVLDAANYVQCGQVPYPDGYLTLRPWIRHVHVKDVAADGAMVVAGKGGCRWPELLDALRGDGYDGYLSLEPHLLRAGQFGGFTGPELFPDAVAALRRLLAELAWTEEAA